MKEITFEDTPPQPHAASANTITEAWANVLRNPSLFIRHWNYKGAVLSGMLRAPIFLITYLIGKESIKLAIGAALAQFAFRFLFAGVGGALIQSFRRVEPAWKALLTILLIVPVISHFFEFLVQSGFAYVTATHNHTDEAIVRSICVSVISALFSLFIMRRNVMIVGEAESKSLFNDITRMPILIFQFVAFIPLEIANMLRRRDFFQALLSILGFGLFAQTLCWAVTSKFYWTYNSGREIFLLKFWGIDGIILMLTATLWASIFLNRKADKISLQ
jgi:hypothetical protein